MKKWNTTHILLIFIFSALITLAAGVALEESGSIIAAHIGCGDCNDFFSFV